MISAERRVRCAFGCLTEPTAAELASCADAVKDVAPSWRLAATGADDGALASSLLSPPRPERDRPLLFAPGRTGADWLRDRDLGREPDLELAEAAEDGVGRMRNGSGEEVGAAAPSPRRVGWTVELDDGRADRLRGGVDGEGGARWPAGGKVACGSDDGASLALALVVGLDETGTRSRYACAVPPPLPGTRVCSSASCWT